MTISIHIESWWQALDFCLALGFGWGVAEMVWRLGARIWKRHHE